MEMRRGEFGPRDLRLMSHWPLAIYAPSEQFDLWRLGRTQGRFLPHQIHLREDQEHIEAPLAIELDIKRDYMLLYSWIKGENAEDYCQQKVIDQDEMDALMRRVDAELYAKGFRVLDNKPRHFILRQSRRNGSLVRRNGKLQYALIDFELLQRTEQHHQQYRSDRRANYWTIQSEAASPRIKEVPPQLASMSIMGVDYLCGPAPNGGHLWVVGQSAELFDYFLPDRWRRTARLKLSSINEVYRTRTRDNIHVVYRRSRVGEKPHVEPAHELGKRILNFGFNSPFEEVAIARAMRAAGLPAVYPRAIYRTGHESYIASAMADRRRHQTHANLRMPGDQQACILSPNHDYYVLWGLWRGLDPLLRESNDRRRGIIDVQQAFDEGLISADIYEHVLYVSRQRLASIGLRDEVHEETLLLLSFNEDGQTFHRDTRGELNLTISLDAQRALEANLLSESAYRDLIDYQRRRLLDAGFEPLALHGDHLLLAADPDGLLHRDAADNLLVTQCNFSLIRVDMKKLTSNSGSGASVPP